MAMDAAIVAATIASTSALDAGLANTNDGAPAGDNWATAKCNAVPWSMDVSCNTSR